MQVTDRFLVGCGVAVGVCGIIALLLLHQFIKIPLGEIDDEGTVRIEATVLGVEQYGNVTRLRLAALVERDAVIFAPVDILAGDRVEVIGEVERYKGRAEILVDELQVLN